MKEYKCTWIDETGDFHVLGYKTTDNPKMFLFDEICKAIVLWGAIFKTDGMPNKIVTCIKTGKTDREHYFADINGQVLSVIEVNYKQAEV